MDVLGFRALVKRSIQSADARNRIHFILKKFGENYHSKGIPGDQVRTEPSILVQQFSDSILRIVPLANKLLKNGSVRPLDVLSEIVHEGIDLSCAQLSLLEEGITVRGGFTLGDLHWEGKEVFGPALVRAYDLQTDLAHYPRIVVDSEITQRLSDSPDEAPSVFSWHTYFRRDFDGVWFVDFLRYFVAFSTPNIKFERKGYRSTFERIRAFLTKELLSDEGSISTRRAKYLWLAEYFNSVVEHAPANSGVDWAELRIRL